jgi:hypothetical protein
MNWFKRSQYDRHHTTETLDTILDHPSFNPPKSSQPDAFKEMFDHDINDVPAEHYKEVKRDPIKATAITLTLYRGFDKDAKRIKREGKNYILSPQGGDQNLLWFACPFFQHNALQTATRGRYLLTYPLQAKKYTETIYYADGSSNDHVPDEYTGNRLDNNRIYMGYELPEGWYFSYKVEKYIVCEKDLAITPDMISMHGH